MAFAADMYYLVFLQQPGKQAADGIVDSDGAEASADDQNDRRCHKNFL